MNLKVEILERVNGRDDIKRSLREALNVPRQSIWRYLVENKNNGPLTTAVAMKIICDGLNVKAEDILSSEPSNFINHDSNFGQPVSRVS